MTVMPFERPSPTHAAVTPQATALDSWTEVISEVAKLASHIADTEFVPKAMRGKPAAVAAAILTGREMGIGPMTALQHISIVQGKPGQSAELMRALVLAQGHEIRYVETNDSRVIVEGRRRGEEEWTRVMFTADQARKQGIPLQQGTYGPEDKLVARATSRLCRRKFSDCVAGMPYTTEELEVEDANRPPLAVESARAESAPAAATAKTTGRTVQRRTRQTAKQEPAAEPASPLQDGTTQARPAGGPPLPGEDGYDTAEPQAAADQQITKEQLTKLHTVLTEYGISDREEKLDIARRVLAQPDLASSTELSKQDASTLIDVLERAGQHEAGFSGYLAELLAATETVDGRKMRSDAPA